MKRKLFEYIFAILYFSSSFSVAMFLINGLASENYISLFGVVAPILAVMFGFSSLMYNRSKIISSLPVQRRCFYAAERTLQALLCFMVGCCIAFTQWYVSLIFELNVTKVVGIAAVYYAIPLLLITSSFSILFLGVRAILHKQLKWISIKNVIELL